MRWSVRRCSWALLVLAGCGRVDFDASADAGPPVTITLVGIGTATGTVTSSTGPTCAPSCTLTVPSGTTVTLTATADTGAWFQGWSGGACSGRRACTLRVDADLAITASFVIEPNRVFVSSATHDGNFGGLAGVDGFCDTLATTAGLTGTWIALVPDGTVPGMSRLASARGWIRTDGEPVMDDTGARAWHAIRRDEHGVDLGIVQLWAPTTNATTQRCLEWTTASAAEGARAYGSERAFQYNSGGGDVTCDRQLHVMCAQVDRIVPIAPTPEPGRGAFVTMAQWTPGGGRDSADALCASEAATAGRTGTYLAMLPSAAEAAPARFPAGLPWVRADGQVLIEGAALAASTPLDVAPALDAGTGFFAYFSVYGGSTAVGTPATTCNDWTSTTGGHMAGCLRTWDTTRSCQSDTCTAKRVLCLEP